MQTSWKNWLGRPSRGFALISVLALVSLAALTATAFLASARLERLATSSIGNTTRLEMALDSGKVCASQVINDNSQPDIGGNTHIVTYWRGSGANDWTNELGYPFIGQIRINSGPQSAIWYYFPLFSPAGVTNLNTNVIQAAMRLTNTHQGTFSNDMSSYMTSATNGFVSSPGLNHPKCVQIPLLGGRTSPPVGWVYMHQEKRKPGTSLTNTSPVVRLAWFTEDLEGLVDAERMGGLTTRSTGTNPEEISLSSALGTSGTALLSSTATFTNRRYAYISYGLLASTSVSGLANPTNARYFASGLRSWAPTNPASPTNGALAWIPVGIPVGGSATDPKGYTNQGYTKLNLNNLVSGASTQAVANIAAVITNNLPGFINRGGGMSGEAYISNIAANIVDYADADTNPTVATLNPNSNLPPWRGTEAIPWANEIFTRFNLQSRTIISNNFRFSLTVKQYVEVWNPSDKNLPVVATNLAISNNMNIAIQCSNWFGNLTNADTNTPPILESMTNANFNLPPNSYGVLSAASRVYTINVPTNLVPAGVTNPSLTLPRSQATPSTNNRYVFYVGGVPVDASQGGRLLGDTTNLRVGDFHFICSSVNFGTSQNGAVYNLAGGDPRAQLFITQPMMAFAYSASTPGGRNRYAPASGGANIVDPKVNWPDGGHSSGADIVASPSSANANNSIAQGLQSQGNPNHWVQKAGDNGNFTNLMELGHIFDPIQWGDPNNPFHPRDSAAWMVLSGSCTNFDGAGGRNTLRIGRAEHPRFAFTNMYGNSVPSIPNMGQSAAALLDLFCITNGTNISGGPHTLGGGKINLNTAPAPVLRALAGGVILTNDQAQIPTNAAIPASMAEAFAQGVMRFRSKYPFLTPSHLCFIGTDSSWPNANSWPTNAVFGNTNTISLDINVPGNTFTEAKINVTAWNDQAAEEWFSKIYSLSSCQSHNYRIYVVAQLVTTNAQGQTNAIGPLVKKYYQIYARNGSSVDALPDVATYPNNTISSWKPTVGTIDIYKSHY